MIWIHVVFLTLILGTGAFFLYLDIMNLRYGERRVREEEDRLREQFGVEDPEKLLKYQRVKTGFSQLQSGIMLAITLLVLYTGLFTRVVEWMESLTLGFTLRGTLFFVGLSVVGVFVSAPFSAFQTFVIEEIFDFNEQTAGLWFLDKLKGLALTAVFASLLSAPILWILKNFPDYWWIGGWGLVVAFGLVMQVLYPRVIAPLFNDFEAVQEGELAEAIEEVFDRAGFSCSQIFTMDASRRSSHSNAYFIGFGRTKRVVLFDTLIDQMEVPQIQSILAHELAHWKKGHIWKNIARQAVRTGVVFYVLYLLLNSAWLYDMFWLPASAEYAALLVAGLWLSPINKWLSPLENYFSIANEREADRFAVEVVGTGEHLIEGLYQLVGENLSNPYPHSLYALFHYTHPPIPQRVEAIEAASSTSSET
ncbi:MAG: M48 family metallopeptidase [bacterium]